MADAVDVDELTSQLYTSEPADFVRVRAEGARALKSAGQADAAAGFAKLAKPSVPAWVVNVLAGQRPAVIDDVIARGDELRRAHTGGAGAAGIRDANQARHDAIERAIGEAERLVDRSLSESHRADVWATLEAASVSSDAATEVRTGRLVRPLAAPTGFDTGGGLTVIKGGKAAAKPTADSRDEGDHGRTATKQPSASRLKVLQSDAEQSVRQAEVAQDSAVESRDRVGELEAERDRLEQQLKDVTSALTSARKDAREAEREAAEAARRAKRAVARVERAET